MDKMLRWKLGLFLLLFIGATYVLFPSFQLYSKPRAEQMAPENERLRERSLKLGLDLVGGMELVLQLDRTKLTDAEVPDAINRAIEVLNNRVDQFGVTEPRIQKQGEDRILIQLPGLTDKARAMELIGQTALLEFKLVQSAEKSRIVLERLDRAIAAAQRGAPMAADSAAVDSLESIERGRPLLDLLYNFPDFSYYPGAMVASTDFDKVVQLLSLVDVEAALPSDSQVAWSAHEEDLGGGLRGPVLYVLKREPEMTGSSIANAQMQFDLDPARPGSPGISMTMNPDGTGKFRRVTGANVGRSLAIVLDGKVQSAPSIRDRIPSGRAQITGSFTDQEAQDLAIVLRAGALPAPVNIIEERSVGPSLGADSIRQGLLAGLVGTVAVLIFMVAYYRGSGMIAVFGMLLNVYFLFAALAILRAALTLPGIAGIVLAIGMSVDANVLIFERIREELRAGKRVQPAIDAGYKRALVTIFDSNLTTLISGIVLAQFGTGPVKGFAVTLMIGVSANLYTAVAATRIIFDLILTRRSVRNLSI